MHKVYKWCGSLRWQKCHLSQSTNVLKPENRSISTASKYQIQWYLYLSYIDSVTEQNNTNLILFIELNQRLKLIWKFLIVRWNTLEQLLSTSNARYWNEITAVVVVVIISYTCENVHFVMPDAVKMDQKAVMQDETFSVWFF